MNTEILLLSLTGAYLFVATFFVHRWLRGRYDRNRELMQWQYKIERTKTAQPLKIQASERLILFIERIKPEGLINRLGAEPTAAALQLAMLSQIRAELEHNLAQQLYVQASTWQKILAARDEVVGLVHRAAAVTRPEESAIVFSRNLFAQDQSAMKYACEQAIQSVKNELPELY
ncbi:MAG: hypothetical protein ACK417_08565 [Bacteroidia bacterium]